MQLHRVAFFLSCLLLATSSSWAFEREGYRGGAIPAFRRAFYDNLMKPFIDEIEHEASLTLVVTSTYCELINQARAGKFDIIMPPPHLARYFIEQENFRLLVATPLPASLVVLSRRDDPVKSLDALEGRTVAVGPKVSYGHYYIENNLEPALIDSIDKMSFNWLDKAFMAMLHGQAEVAIVTSSMYHMLSEPVRSSLHVLKINMDFPMVPILVSSKLSATDIDGFRRAFLDAGNNPQVAAMFNRFSLAPFQYEEDLLQSILHNNPAMMKFDCED